MITLIEKKPLVFKLRLRLTKLLINRKIKYSSKRGGNCISINIINKEVKREIERYYSDLGFNVFGGNYYTFTEIRWKVIK